MGVLATSEDVEAVIQQAIDDPVQLARVNRLLEMASALVRREVGQQFDLVSGDTATLLVPRYENELWLAQVPVGAVSSITIDGVTLDPDAYQVHPSGRVAIFRWAAIDGEGFDGIPIDRDAVVTVTYDHGFSRVPDEVAFVVADLVATQITNPQGARQSSETIGQSTRSLTFAGDGISTGLALTAEHRRILSAYRGPIQPVHLCR